VADERSERGVCEVETVGDGAAEDAAVLFPLRKKFTLNPGTTMIELQNRSAVHRYLCLFLFALLFALIFCRC